MDTNYRSCGDCLEAYQKLNLQGSSAHIINTVNGWQIIPFAQLDASYESASDTIQKLCSQLDLLNVNGSNNKIQEITDIFTTAHPQLASMIKANIDQEMKEYERAISAIRDACYYFKIKDYKITNQSLLFDIALKAVKRDARFHLGDIQNYEITSEKWRYELAQLAAEQERVVIGAYIKNFRITNEEWRYQILEKVAKRFPEEALNWFENFEITNEEWRYQILLKIVEREPIIALDKFNAFEITDKEKIFQILLKGAELLGKCVVEYIEKFGITDEEHITQILEKVAGVGDEYDEEFVSKNIDKFKIQSEERRFRIALAAAGKKGSYVSEYFYHYEITNKDWCFQVALKALEKSPYKVCRFIFRYNLEAQDELFTIAKLVAAQSGDAISRHITNFGIKVQERRYEIALLAVAQDGAGTCASIGNYNLSYERRLRIALRAVARFGAGVNLYLKEYPLAKEELSLLVRFSEMQSNPSLMNQDVYLSLLNEAFGRGVPLFLMKVESSSFIQKYMCEWIIEFLLQCEGVANDDIAAEEALLTQLTDLRNPSLRLQVTAHLKGVFTDKIKWNEMKAWTHENERRKLAKKDSSLLPRMLLLGCDANISKKLYKDFYSKLKDPFDQEVFILFLQRIKHLPVEDQNALLEMVSKRVKIKEMLHSMKAIVGLAGFGDPKLLSREALKSTTIEAQLEKAFLQELEGLKVDNFQNAYEKTIDKFRKRELIFTYLASLKNHKREAISDKDKIIPYFKDFIEFVMNETFCIKRYEIPHLEMIYKEFPQLKEQWQKGEHELTEADLLGVDRSGKIESDQVQIPISKSDMSDSIIKFKHLSENVQVEYPVLYQCLTNEKKDHELSIKYLSDVKNDNKAQIQLYCLKLLKPDLKVSEKKEYLSVLAKLCDGTQFKNDVMGWLRLMYSAKVGDYSISDTDKAEDLFLLGEEVEGSCQKITGGGISNRGLLGYLLNGYNRAVVVKDQTGAIVARSLIRLYWDGKRPVLYQERFYTRSNDKLLKVLVDEMCLRRAKAMQLPLVCADNTLMKYEGELEMRGGLAEMEYVDANGKIETSRHKVLNSFVIWDPIDNPH